MRHHCFIVVVLASLTVAVFWRAGACQFVNYDDNEYVTENPRVQQGLTPGNIAWAFTTGATGYWHPLTWLSLMLNTDISGTGPRGYHLGNVLLHVLGVALLYGALCAMTGSSWRSGLVAGIWAIHPLRVESVAWVSERKDVLCGCFGLAAILAYAAYARRPNWRRYLGVAVLFILGLMAKPMLVTLPFLLLLLDVWPLCRISNWALPAPSRHPPACPPLPVGAAVLEKVPLLIISLAASVVTYVVPRSQGIIGDLSQAPMATRLPNALISYVRYLSKMVWFGDLIVDYPPQSWPLWQVAGAAVLLLAITVMVCVGFRGFRGSPWLAIGWFWFLGLLVPVIGLVHAGNQSMADRYTYLPAVGLLVMAVWSLPDRLVAFKPGRVAVGAAAMVVAATLGAFTYRQIGYWHDSLTLFEHALAVEPDYVVALDDVGYTLDQQGRAGEAQSYLQKAVRLMPSDGNAQLNLGWVLMELNRPAEALPHLRAATEIDSGRALAHVALGQDYINLQKFDWATGELHRALALDPGCAPAHEILGYMLSVQRRLPEAQAEYTRALSLDPNDFKVYVQMANVLARMGRYDQVLPIWRQVMRRWPDNALGYAFLGQTLVRMHREDEAIGYLETAIHMEPGNPRFQAMLAQARAAERHGGTATRAAVTQP